MAMLWYDLPFCDTVHLKTVLELTEGKLRYPKLMLCSVLYIYFYSMQKIKEVFLLYMNYVATSFLIYLKSRNQHKNSSETMLQPKTVIPGLHLLWNALNQGTSKRHLDRT